MLTIYTAEQVAEALQVSVKTVRQHTTLGLMPCRRLGRSIRYTDADLAEYLRRIADDGAA